MLIDRRTFIQLAAAGTVSGTLIPAAQARASAAPRCKAVLFDGFPIFDPRPVLKLAEETFPGKGPELSGAWRTRQFEYQWLRALGGHYADFIQTTEEALVCAAALLKLDLTPERRKRLVQKYGELPVWPDVPASLESLRAAGVRLGFLSNMTAGMLHDGLRRAGLAGAFEHVLSTDELKSYKPDPRAYRLGTTAFRLKREEILFAAFAGWDAAGARWFGYPTFWVNRLDAPAEELGIAADGTGKDLRALVSFVLGE